MERLGGGVDIGLVKRAHRVPTDLSDESHLQNKDLGNLLISLSAFNIQIMICCNQRVAFCSCAASLTKT